MAARRRYVILLFGPYAVFPRRLQILKMNIFFRPLPLKYLDLKTQVKANLALLGTNFFFAINYNGIKYFTLNNLAGPFGINIIRVAGSMILFWILFAFRKEKQDIKTRDLVRLAVCSFAAIGLNQMLFIKGLSYTSPVHASLLTLISPILITLFAMYVLRERLTLIKFAGIALALTGALLLLKGKESFEGDNFLLGDALVIASSVAYAFYFILVKPLMNRYSPVMVTRWIFTFGFIMTLPFCVSEFRVIPFSSFSFNQWMVLLIIVVPGTFLAYVFNVYGLKILNASIAGAYIYTQPLLTGIIAVVFLSEAVTAYKILSTVLIFTGLYLVQRKIQKNIKPIES